MIKNQLTRSRRHQKGQSTIEMIVLSLVLVPLMLILPLLGKFLDISETTAEASRYMALEATVHHTSSKGGWKSEDKLAQEVRRRFFSNADAPIKTNDSAGNFDANRNQLWYDHQNNALLPDYSSNIAVKSTIQDYDQPLGAAYSGAFGLPKDNLYTGTVTVNIANVPGLKEFTDNTKALKVERHMAILVDPWAASGPGQVESGVDNQAVYPYKLSMLDTVATVMRPVISAFEFGASPPKIGRVDPDWVPKDRVLKPYVK